MGSQMRHATAGVEHAGLYRVPGARLPGDQHLPRLWVGMISVHYSGEEDVRGILVDCAIDPRSNCAAARAWRVIVSNSGPRHSEVRLHDPPPRMGNFLDRNGATKMMHVRSILAQTTHCYCRDCGYAQQCTSSDLSTAQINSPKLTARGQANELCRFARTTRTGESG